jgi:sugar lactone lactonase YvrE
MSIRQIAVAELETYGRNLKRPECVLVTADGDVCVPRWPGGVTVMTAAGQQVDYLATTPEMDLRPNGIDLQPDGSFLIANLGDAGGIWRLSSDGHLSPFLLEVDGIDLPPANFVTRDARDRFWISVSTRQRPRQLAWRPDVADGFVVVVDRRGARIVADGLFYTNEVRVDPSGTWLYVVETFGAQLRRFRIGPDNTLSAPEIVGAFGRGCFPDGFAFDEAGGIWVTSLVSNRLMRLTATELTTVLEDANVSYVDRVQRAFSAGEMRADHLGPIDGTRLQQLTSIAFGGPDRRTVYLGSLHADCLYRFRAPVAGVAPVHWRYGIFKTRQAGSARAGS